MSARHKVEAVARGQDRILLVMATGTGKTYTALGMSSELVRAFGGKPACQGALRELEGAHYARCQPPES